MKRIGKNFRIGFVGANKVVAIGTVTVPGVTTDQIDVSAMGDSFKSFMFGLKDGGELVFSGSWDPDDTAGQEFLRASNLAASPLTNLAIYIDNTSYLVACQTTGYFNENLSSGQLTQASYFTVTKINIKADVKGIAQVDFTAKLSGCLALV
jgi:hypothetical protein